MKKIIGYLALFAALAGAAYYAYAFMPESVPVEVKQVARPAEYEGDIRAVMGREDFKRQQELLAKEIVLKEEKARLQAKIAEIEKGLEQVRSERVSF